MFGMMTGRAQSYLGTGGQTMYDVLVNSLRICGKMRSADDYCVAFHDGCCEAEPVCMYELMAKAADAIEELIDKLNHADDQIDRLVEAAEERRWIPVSESPCA
jgi:hypothetical protein